MWIVDYWVRITPYVEALSNNLLNIGQWCRIYWTFTGSVSQTVQHGGFPNTNEKMQISESGGYITIINIEVSLKLKITGF